MKWRYWVFFSIIAIIAAIMVGRLFYLQVVAGKLYQAQALGQQSGFNEVSGARGQIFFSNSKENDGAFATGDIKNLAINKDSWMLSAIPKNIKDKDAAAKALADIIGVPKTSVLELLAKSDSYVVIKKDLSTDQSVAIKKLAIIGLAQEKSLQRYYPENFMAAQVVGFVGGDNTGQYGIEGYYDDVLAGKQGIQENKKGLGVIGQDTTVDLNGSDIYLTLDYNIQFQAEQLLVDEKAKDDIQSGQIIVIKPDTGRILALANFPSFDLNNYSKTNLETFQDPAMQKLFEPGSVFKAFTMAMALQEGKVTPDSTFTDTGVVKIGPDTVYNFNHEKYGLQTMSGILEKSINTGAVFLEQLIPHQTFIDYLEKLGFNNKTGVQLQGEVASQNNILKNGSAFGFATAAFGQGIEMTPMQLIKAFAVFANGGKIVKPYIVDKIVHGADQEVTRPVISSPVFSQTAILQTNQMLINVVDHGYGDGAKIPGYYLAGKTGTAQVPYENKKGYYPDKTIQSFVGYGPASNSKFLILVKLDDPKVPKSALSAVPIFKKLAQYIINYWQIPPDYPMAVKKQ